MSNYLCFSGWGQKFNSLQVIFENNTSLNNNIDHFNYSKFCNIESLFNHFGKNNLRSKYDTLIGWSLGGQIICRLVAQKLLKPKKIILIAPPFQFVKDSRINAAMPRKSYDKFYNDFITSPIKTLKKFTILAAINDKNAKQITKDLQITNKNFNNLIYWLEELAKFSLFNISFNDFCPVIYVHGDSDMIVNIRQLNYFKARIRNFKEEIFPNCGHAPHLSNLERFRNIINSS